ncbi:MAG: right-handed parallel beta-helix repeat-containing protein [Kiritimatiellae bacterium]|nr:right-handed parallel beta-helix repeat-containing protein [Kiritimatiellia bacterium]
MNKSMLAGVVLLAVVWSAKSDTYYVATNGHDNVAGTDWTTALLTISNAVAKTTLNGNDRILVSNGTYVLSTNIYITNGITLSGFNGRNVTIINANPAVSNRCVFIDHSNAIVERFTLTGGNMPTNTFANSGRGGGGYINNGTLRDCIVSNNIGVQGGGVFNANGLVTNCDIMSNMAWGVGSVDYGVAGGGLACRDGAGEVYDCRIFGNTATSTVSGYGAGGGVCFYASSKNALMNCTISNNFSYSHGGGVLIQGAGSNAIVISNCIIVANASSKNDGGGIYQRLFTSTITDTIISNNASYGVGGGFFSSTSTSGWYNCKIVANAGLYGGGISLSASSLLLSNCDVNYNTTTRDSGKKGYGGGINSGWYAGNTITAIWCRIMNNCVQAYAGGGYGAGIYAKNDCMLDHCFIQSNYFQYATLASYSNYGAGVFIRSGGNGIIRNCLITDNVATGSHATLGGFGGGIYIEPNADVRVSACTVAGNYAKIRGGGVYLEGDGSDTFTNSVIASNRLAAAAADNDLYLPTSARSNAFYYSCGNVLPNTQGNITNAPVFDGASTHNWRLANGSPGCGAGTIEAWMRGNMDLDGRPRIWRGFGGVNMGAYEREHKGVVFSIH